MSLDKATGLRFRFWMFFLGCIGSRSLFTWMASRVSSTGLRIMGAMAMVPVIGWLWLIFVGRRDTGLEVLGDRIWWVGLRPVHLLLWAFFAYLAFCGIRWAWIVLAVDTAFGAGAFLAHHSAEGNLRTMIGL